MNETAKEETMIRIQKRTRDRLKELGKKGESYNDVITRLLKERDEKRRKNPGGNVDEQKK